jgi:osmotically-inducible protein OsmY
MKTDEQLQNDVLEELRWDPSLKASDIGVLATDGVVALTGTVRTFAEKCAAELAARRVSGVRAILGEMHIIHVGAHERTDEEIADTVMRSLEAHA